MNRLEIPLPNIEGVELKSASVDLEKGLVIAEYGEKEQKFKRGDIIKYVSPNSSYGISLVDYIDATGLIHVLASTGTGCDLQHSINKGQNVGNINDKHNKHILANKSQREDLLKQLKGLNKYWDPEALEIKDIPLEKRIKEVLRLVLDGDLSVNDAYHKIDKLIPINS